MQLRLFPKDITYLNNLIAFKNQEGTVYYFNGSMPIYSHDEKDVNAFKMFVAQLYVNGHVRVYSGKNANLPRKYVSRERLCLKGITDYWVNDALGQPFFVISKAVSPGLLSVLREDIVPRLV